jgi:hypothetical protein
MNYQVPQFIEVEDKLFSYFTFKQGIYIAGGAGLSFILYIFIPIKIIAIVLIILIMSFCLALSFYPVNNRPLIFTLEAAFNYYKKSKLYLWKKADKIQASPAKAVGDSPTQIPVNVPKLSESKLKDLAWSLDIHEGMNSSNKNQPR